MGVLAGWNNIIIDNCAVAGYYIAGSDGTLQPRALHALRRRLVGGNAGTITNCAADCPEIRLTSFFANASRGGFVGQIRQSGCVQNCYALGFLKVTTTAAAPCTSAGFCGENDGQLSNCSAPPRWSRRQRVRRPRLRATGGLVTTASSNNGTYDFVGAPAATPRRPGTPPASR
jgi:hypothetical protein